MTSSTTSPWVLVLAAGEGHRVKAFTRDRQGQPAPKQFSSVDGKTTLLGETLRRAERITPAERIVTIVAAQHERWWKSDLTKLPAGNIIVQPENRGTAAGILLAQLWISRHDDKATVVILPSDHHVESEDTLSRSLAVAISAVLRSVAPVVLLGVEPDGPAEDFGWIVPRPGPESWPHRVASFREKPDAATARSLLIHGALLNTFIIVANSARLLALFEENLPALWRLFAQTLTNSGDGSWPQQEFEDLYQSIPTLDFSREVLQEAAEHIWVCPVPSCGWTDLGSPQRLAEYFLRQRGQVPPGRSDAVQSAQPSMNPHDVLEKTGAGFLGPDPPAMTSSS